jgi:RNA polymerase sigma-54 factor
VPGIRQQAAAVQSQRQTLAPRAIESLRILRLPAVELLPLVQEALKANPALEEIPPEQPAPADAGELDDAAPPASSAPGDGEAHDRLLASRTAQPTLREHLRRQLALATAGPETQAAAAHLIDTLDGNGHLTETAAETAAETGLSEAVVRDATRLLQTFDPAGIAAGSLRDSLLLQLAARNRSDSLAARILREQLPLLERRKTEKLADVLGVSPARVREAVAEITALDPAPARRFAPDTPDTNRHIEPDLVLSPDGTVSLGEERLPPLRVSESCAGLIARDALNAGDLAYLRARIRDARALIGALAQRRATLLKVARAILEAQPGFLRNGVAGLRPLTMAGIAAATGLHETTVSRAVAGKFIATPRGTLPLRRFFSAALPSGEGGARSAAAVRERVQDLIAAEDPDARLTDEALREKLAAEGVRVSRRTLAKYREVLRIPPSDAR